MDYGKFVDELTAQATAMRAAVVAAGPDAPVPTCPEWTVRRLVRHLARVHQWAGRCLRTGPDGDSPAPDEPPAEWDGLLSWWDEQVTTLVNTLRERDSGTPAWVFVRPEPAVAGFWARRQAHETAIHRLDAEHAAAGSDQPDAVPTLVYDPEFAADGIAEALDLLIPRRLAREPATVEGTVLFHAADAGQAWLVRLRPGAPLEISTAGPTLDADASVVGTADAVYRATWHRPSHAVTGGDLALVAALKVP